MFKGHPKGLFVLSLANMGERFGYYTMLAIFVLFMQANSDSVPMRPVPFLEVFSRPSISYR